MDTSEAATTSRPPPRRIEAGQVADFLLSQRHLAAAFELYQDYLSRPQDEARSRNGQDKEFDGGMVEDGEDEACGALELYFADSRKFPLPDLQRYANAVDSKLELEGSGYQGIVWVHGG
mmetsp:Transcript_1925/g.3023  ORF Transcript_1925/g.3023 Transcript_1925/m.3023 type:complete len:119 (-) Transcript_1925:65-421(-)